MTALEDLPVAGTAVILRDADVGFEVLMIRRPDRGAFPGGWVFPGGKVEDSDRMPGADESSEAQLAAIRETFEEVGLHIDSPVLLSSWRPPAETPARIRTWFFLAHDPGGSLVLSAGEVIEAAWVRPAEALRRHAAGEWILFPPTWVTLHELAAAADIAAVFAGAGEARVYSTQLMRTDQGQVFVWEGDAEHAAGVLASDARHRLEAGSLPWTYVRR